jgi:predicted transcriptional regulator
MTQDLPQVTETELAILHVLWERGASPIRDIVVALYDQHKTSLHATVKSLLERLEDKGYVACDKNGFAHRFSATVSRDAYVGQQIKLLAESHFHGAVGPMLLTLVDRIKLSRKDRETIRKIIAGIK